MSSSMRKVKKPIILLGTGRSGTNLLARIFQRHPDVALWNEPRPIWMYGNAYRGDHELTAENLSPRIARYIDRRFARFQQRRGKARFAEKTPSNCLRIPFIHALFPDCKIINMLRDGRAVVGGWVRIQDAPSLKQRLWARVIETPLLEWPAYIPLFFATSFRTMILRRPATYWGSKPKGWKEWVDLPKHVLGARQWKHIAGASIRDGRALPQECYLEMRYEDLIQDPVGAVTRMIEFTELSRADEMLDYARDTIDPTRAAKAKARLTPVQMAEAEREMQPLLSELGYGESAPASVDEEPVSA